MRHCHWSLQRQLPALAACFVLFRHHLLLQLLLTQLWMNGTAAGSSTFWQVLQLHLWVLHQLLRWLLLDSLAELILAARFWDLDMQP